MPLILQDEYSYALISSIPCGRVGDAYIPANFDDTYDNHVWLDQNTGSFEVHMYLLQPQTLFGSDNTPMQPIIHVSTLNPSGVEWQEEIDVKPSSPLQHVLASLVDLDSRS